MIVIATIIAISSYSKSKLFFAATIYVSCVWLSAQYITQIFSLGNAIELSLIQFSSVISFVMAVFFYCFIRLYIDKNLSIKTYVLFSIFFITELILHMSGFVIQKAWGDYAGIIISQSTNLYQIYIAVVGFVFAVSFYQLVKATLGTKSKRDKARDRLLIFGILQAVLLAIVSSIFLKSSAEAQMSAPISFLIMSIMVGFAIVKYQLFYIKLAVIRTFAYILSLATLSVVYYYLAYIISLVFFNGSTSSSVSFSPVNIVLALLLAFIFQPVKRFFDKVTNRVFYKDSYNSDDFFARLNRSLTLTTDLRGLLERAAYEIGHTLKSEQAFFFINTDDGHYV